MMGNNSLTLLGVIVFGLKIASYQYKNHYYSIYLLGPVM